MKDFKFILVSSYAPEQYNIVDENNKLIAFLRMRWGQLNVYPYKDNEIDFKTSIFKLDFDEEYLGAIPDNMKDELFSTIKNKLNEIQ